MKKLTFFAALIMLFNLSFAGGLLTNYNQSAQYIRMMSRNASLDIDAVYYNPAGLIKLEDGWHFSVNNQTIFQDKNVHTGYTYLNDPDYLGKVAAPVFPTAFGVYKKDKWAFSLGIGPNAGGGSAEFERGLPSFEIPIAQLVPALSGLAAISPDYTVTGYDADLYFNGSSVFWGIQLGATYKISEIFSVYGGVRILPAKNTYEGSIKNIQLEVNGSLVPAQSWLSGASSNLGNLGAMATDGAAQMQPIIDGGGGSFNLDQLVGAGFITPAEKTQIVAGMAILGVPPAQTNAMPVSQIQGTFAGAGAQLTATSATLSATAAQLGDKVVDTEQTKTAITPIIGVNISPNEDWNIGIKYEHMTYLTLNNERKPDDNYDLFGSTVDSYVPGILAVGVGYKGLKWLEAQVSYNEYFNKNVYWGINVRDMSSWQQFDQSKIRQRESDNGYEIGLGLQFNLSDKISVSTGGLYGDMKVKPSYQSDFSYSNPSFTFGAGVMWKITDKLKLDAGFSNTFYQDQTVTFTDPFVPSYDDVYGKTTIDFAVGLSYSIF